MNIVTLNPFGALNQEAGILAVLGNYLKSCGHQTSQLICDGAFGACDRDLKTNDETNSEASKSRNIHSCAKCIKEQDHFTNWSGIDRLRISQFITPEDYREVYHLIQTTKAEKLSNLQFQQYQLLKLNENYLKLRFGSLHFDFEQPENFLVVQKAYTTSMLAILAAQRFYARQRPQAILIAGGSDNISLSFHSVLKHEKCEVFNFIWNLNARAIEIVNPLQPEHLACQLIMNNITSSRADIRTWPSDLITVVQKILDYLAIPQSAQLSQLAQ